MAVEITFRARRILYAAITEYIATGEPVGSRKLSKRYGLNLSPASIRNVLADLTDSGFLAQPHTSAGRVPTDQGFRIFVDALVQMRDVSAEDRSAVVARLQNLTSGHDIMREAGKLLSSLTGAATVVTAPKPEDEQLLQLRFMPLRDDQLLVVLVTRSGAVQNRVITVDAVEPAALEELNNFLAEMIDGRTLIEIRNVLAEEMKSEAGEYQRIRRQAKRLLDVAATSPTEDGAVVIEGQGRLFDRPEFVDVEKVRSYLRAFEQREELLDLLDHTIAAGGVRVVIGSETGIADVQDISVISSTYTKTGAAAGTLGVIGPARMDYAKVVPLVGFTAKVMSDLLGGGSVDEDT